MRVTKDPVGAAALPDTTSRPARLDIAAAPTARPGGPTPYDEGQDIARALAGINPSLNRFLESKVQADGSEQFAAGQRARAMQPDSAPVAMTPEQDPYWQQGYMKMHGIMAGSEDAVKMEQDYQLQKNDPNFDVNKFLADRRKQHLTGLSDKDALAGYLPRMEASVTKIQEDWAKTVVVQAREAKNTAVNTMIADHQRSLPDMSNEQAASGFQTLQAQAFLQGIPRKEFTNRYIAAIVNNPNAGPTDFDFLNVKGPDGIAPAQTDAPDGQPWATHIEKTRAQAYHREEQRLAQAQGEANAKLSLWIDQALKIDPTQFDAEAFVTAQTHHGGLAANPGAASALYSKITKAQDEWKYNQMVQAAIAGMSPSLRMMAAEPVVKQQIEGQYLQNWASVDPQDPNKFKQAIEKSTQLFEASGVPDPHIKSLAEKVFTAGTVTDQATGKETLSPDVRIAYALWTGLKQSNNPQLSSFNDESTIFLTNLDAGLRAGYPEVEALKMAKTAQSSEAMRRRKEMFPAGQEDAARQQTADWFDKTFALNGNGWWPTVANKDDVARKVMDLSKLYYSGGMTSADDAVKAARERVMATSAYDGYKGMFSLPIGVGKDEGQKLVGLLVGQAQLAWEKTHDGAQLERYSVQTRTVNGQPVFSVTTPIGDEIVPPQTLETLRQARAWADGNQPEQIAEKNAQSQAAKAAGTQEVANTQQVLEDPLDTLQGKLARGQISPQQYRDELQKMRDAQASERDAKAKAFADKLRAQPQFPPPSQVNPQMKERVPGPVGVEQSPKEIALTQADQNAGYALTTMGEGFRNVVYKDDKGNRTLGFGYNLDARKPEEVRKDLVAAGVTDPGRLDRVVAGKEGITPEEGRRLFDRIIPTYENIAREFVGDSIWNVLPPNRKAVLTDMAYNAGGNKFVFGKVVDALKAGDYDGAAQNIRGLSKRRLDLQLAMWQSTDHFKQLVNRGI